MEDKISFKKWKPSFKYLYILKQNPVLVWKWYLNKKKYNDKALSEIALNLGVRLKERNYLGKDVDTRNKDQLISTTLSFCLIGWHQYYLRTNDESGYNEANVLKDKLIEIQDDDGAWKFPFAFRKNGAFHVYSCENFMTLRGLLYYYGFINSDKDVLNSILKNAEYLEKNIGYSEDGQFWYSAADQDHVYVPNISSMAANVFAQVGNITSDKSYLELARKMALYCVKWQNEGGGYPYQRNSQKVYIPYHALELWELYEANKVLRIDALNKSVDNGLQFLLNFIDSYGLSSLNQKKLISPWVSKTPLWIAKALVTLNKGQIAIDLIKDGLRL